MTTNQVFLHRGCVKVSQEGRSFLERRGRELRGGLWEFKEMGQVMRESKRSEAD